MVLLNWKNYLRDNICIKQEALRVITLKLSNQMNAFVILLLGMSSTVLLGIHHFLGRPRCLQRASFSNYRYF